MTFDSKQPVRGRGAGANPTGRFEPLDVVLDPESIDPDEPKPKTQFFTDTSRSIIVSNDSPDVGFDKSINPYRGCEHGCIYCYARPTHEYMGFSAGLDFETKIVVKKDAPELLRKELSSKSWKPQAVALSGNTDCYQPIERQLKLTRQCLEVFAEFSNPVIIITKNHLVTRDIDLLSALASDHAVSVNISITTLDRHLTSIMEPRTSRPDRRLAAIEALSSAGIPTGVLVAPMIPGLTDHEIPSVVEAACRAGASFASYTIVRLPHAVAPLFEKWLGDHLPDHKEKVLNRIRAIRGGRLNDPRFESRQRGSGIFADQMAAMFNLACKKAGIHRARPALSTKAFRRPASDQTNDQMSLFE
jgi:DNA repair photolyase